MMERDFELTVPDGTSDAVLFAPEEVKALPGVLFIPDIGGIRETMREMARRVAAEGYTVLMPNPFYRTSRSPVFDFPRTPGDPRVMKRMEELWGPLSGENVDKDTAAYVDALMAQPGLTKMGAVGFCIGGMIALRAAAARPEQVKAAASFHGGGLYRENNPDSPHLVLPKVRARLYFGHASEDKSMDANAIAGLDQALQVWGGEQKSEVYAARHGWTVPDNPAYNQPEAERAYGRLKELFQQPLG
jgi:carboxymethylenebutenolidase